MYADRFIAGAVSAAREGIRAYNNTSHATANPTTTQETLFDQDNWGRVLDSREIVYLVQPLIEKLYDPQISACVDTQTRSAFEEAQGEGSSSSDISSPQTTPKEMEDFLNEANTVARSATRLAEYLVICDGGPAGSTSTRWRLHVTAAIEAALETLDAYTNLSTQLRDAVSDTPMGNISAVLTLQDTEILPKAQIAFQPIFAGRKDFPYQLRLTSERQCLHIGELASSQRSGSSWSAWKVAGMVAGVAAAGAAGGLVLYGAKKIYEHRHPKSRSNQSLDRGMIGPMGGPNGKLAFVPTSNCPDAESLGKDLYQAAAGGHLTDVTSMLRKGADPSYCTEFRWTPLHWAASNGHVAIVRVLVHSGADLNALSDTKVTPLDMSMNEKHLVISEFLKSHRGLTSSQLSSEKIPIFQDDKSKNWETEICPIENEKVC